jgi:hypothetical protein
MCRCLPLIGYLDDQMLCQTPATYCNGIDFFYVIICWSTHVVGNYGQTVTVVSKMTTPVKGQHLSSNFQNMCHIREDKNRVN